MIVQCKDLSQPVKGRGEDSTDLKVVSQELRFGAGRGCAEECRLWQARELVLRKAKRRDNGRDGR